MKFVSLLLILCLSFFNIKASDFSDLTLAMDKDMNLVSLIQNAKAVLGDNSYQNVPKVEFLLHYLTDVNFAVLANSVMSDKEALLRSILKIQNGNDLYNNFKLAMSNAPLRYDDQEFNDMVKPVLATGTRDLQGKKMNMLNANSI